MWYNCTVVDVAVIVRGGRGFRVADYSDAVNALWNDFGGYRHANTQKAAYYDGKQRLKDLGISTPPQLRHMDAVIGWPGTAVDVLEERLDFEGWDITDLDLVYRANDLDVKSSQAHLDALIYGTSFVTVTSGREGEPDVLVSVVSPNDIVARRDNRTGRVLEACQYISGDVPGSQEGSTAVLFREDETVWLSFDRGDWVVTAKDEHGLGRVPVVQLVNRPRASKLNGRSEITPAVRSYTDMALRTLVGSEVAREFYAVPQRYLLGAPEEFFTDEDGNPRGAWDAMAGKILAIGRDEDTGEIPTTGAYPSHSPQPFFEQIRQLAQLLSAETSIPQSYLGFSTDNPSSADAIRMAENRLVKRAERRQGMFGKAWTEVARLALMVRDGRGYGSLSDDELTIRPLWRDASTPTRAAAADEVVKMIQVGVYPAQGDYAMKRLGLSPQDREMLRRDRAGDTQGVLARLEAQLAQPDPVADALVDRGDSNVE